MSKGYAVDANNRIVSVFTRCAPGADGDTYRTATIKIPTDQDTVVPEAVGSVFANDKVVLGGVVVTASEVQEALWAFLTDCVDKWDIGLLLEDTAVRVFGRAALLAARQAAINYAQDTAYTTNTREKGLRNLCLGSAAGVNVPAVDSPQALAGAIHQFDNIDPTQITKFILWINRATGELITVPDAF